MKTAKKDKEEGTLVWYKLSEPFWGFKTIAIDSYKSKALGHCFDIIVKEHGNLEFVQTVQTKKLDDVFKEIGYVLLEGEI